jgi:predicted transposase/invertase (TIGR01784 family)
MLNTSMMGYGQVLLMRGERRGKLEGRLEGERRGKLEGKLETARSALKMGLSMEQIAQMTGIPADELKRQLG